MTRTVLIVAALLSVAANSPAAAQYDYPGEYAQRFDGTLPGGNARARPSGRIHFDSFRGGVREGATRTPRIRQLRIR
jgi:hypothetical protein